MHKYQSIDAAIRSISVAKFEFVLYAPANHGIIHIDYSILFF